MISESAQYEDLKDLLCGERLGAGIHREVFVYKPDPKYVMKIAPDAPEANVLEAHIWDMVADTNIAKWFARCHMVSTSGVFLLQERVERRPQAEYPKHVPVFFGDLKYKNFGWIGGRLVCCDYAGFVSTSMVHKWTGRMKKADWWE